MFAGQGVAHLIDELMKKNIIKVQPIDGYVLANCKSPKLIADHLRSKKKSFAEIRNPPSHRRKMQETMIHQGAHQSPSYSSIMRREGKTSS
jgi:hypothetical protein